MEFVEKFKNLRKKLGLNQTEFGNIFGLSQRVISDIENGKSSPSKTLLSYLKYRWHDIFTDELDSDCGADVIDLPHEEVIRGFKDKDLAQEISINLLELEGIDPAKLMEVRAYIKGIITGLKSEYKLDRRSGDDRRKEDIPELTPEVDRRSGNERRVAGLNS